MQTRPDSPELLPATPTAAHGRKVLLVEDHPDIGYLTVRFLEMKEFAVQWVQTFAAALNAANQGRFDVVVSDLDLPDGTGIDLMRQLRELYPLQGIAMSGYGQDEDVARSLDAGFARHMVKPVNFDELAEVIGELTALPSKTAATTLAGGR